MKNYTQYAMIFIALFLSTKSIAQSKVMYGPKFGMNFSRLYGSGVTKDNLKSTIGPVFGGVFRTSNFDKLFAMQFELLYSVQGSRYKNAGAYDKSVFRTQYLKLPVLASFSFGDKKVKAFLNGGPYLGFWLAKKAILKNGDKTKTSLSFQDDDMRIDFGADVGFGLAINAGRGVIVPEFRAGFGFISISDVSSQKNVVLCFAVTYLFGGDPK